ncbi:S49 family peptidase [Oceanibium sediminis]|uniref:S49 family peptidase n=1 Tax=Oceanibium sediminis TaxID=2026339 RepID=UPI000DD394C3|nr:S49 family peptidase [Oceanibium sediminis]
MVLIRNPLSRAPVVSVIRLEGMISSAARGSGGLSDAATAEMIERAFRRKPTAVALQINSPGGSPVQSALIAARIRRLAAEKQLRVYAFCEDVAASGGYWLATAADEIYADANSILGSIGVISASFGLHELIARYGIERRVYTAGEDKSMLDPFRPEREEDVVRLKAIQAQVHQNFISQVQSRRAKLDTTKDLFSGEIFVGQTAVDVGLADGLGHLAPVIKQKYGEKVRFQVYRPRRSLLSRFGLPGAAAAALSGIEERALWSRYGL